MGSASADSVESYQLHPQFGQDRGEDFGEGFGSRSPLGLEPSQFLRQRSRFFSVVRGRKLDCRGIEVSQKLIAATCRFSALARRIETESGSTPDPGLVPLSPYCGACPGRSCP